MGRKRSKKSIDWNKYLPIIVILGVVTVVLLVSFSPSGKFFELGPATGPIEGLDLPGAPGLPEGADFPKEGGMSDRDKEDLFDNDLDGYPAYQDCDDNDPNVQVSYTFYTYDDLDEDGYGNDSTVVTETKCYSANVGVAQPLPARKTSKGGDTDDSDPTIPEFEEFYTSFTHTSTPISQGGGGTAVWQDRNNDGVKSLPIGTIFLTTVSDPYLGNLSQVAGAKTGLEGADILCTQEATDTSNNKAVFEGKWYALLGDSNTYAIDRVQDVKFRDVYGRLIAQDKSQLSSGPFSNYVEYTSYGWSWNSYTGNSNFFRPIWLGHWTSQVPLPIGTIDCNSWTMNQNFFGYVMGTRNTRLGQWGSQGSPQGCGSGGLIMCVRMETEQLCTDGIDNDADGRIDCKDSDCLPCP